MLLEILQQAQEQVKTSTLSCLLWGSSITMAMPTYIRPQAVENVLHATSKSVPYFIWNAYWVVKILKKNVVFNMENLLICPNYYRGLEFQTSSDCYIHTCRSKIYFCVFVAKLCTTKSLGIVCRSFLLLPRILFSWIIETLRSSL